jgi:hypothetical protein
MRRHLEDSDDWDAGCGCHGCCCGGDRSDDWSDRGDDDPTVPCPYCGKEVYDDSPRCPHCGQYISEEDAPPRRTPWWIILGVLLCLCVILVWILAF